MHFIFDRKCSVSNLLLRDVMLRQRDGIYICARYSNGMSDSRIRQQLAGGKYEI